MDQPGKVANPARGQLNRENEHFPVRVPWKDKSIDCVQSDIRPAQKPARHILICGFPGKHPTFPFLFFFRLFLSFSFLFFYSRSSFVFPVQQNSG